MPIKGERKKEVLKAPADEEELNMSRPYTKEEWNDLQQALKEEFDQLLDSESMREGGFEINENPE